MALAKITPMRIIADASFFEAAGRSSTSAVPNIVATINANHRSARFIKVLETDDPWAMSQ
jgi:hypothetical protein